MNFIEAFLPVISVIGIYAARLIELKTDRGIVPGSIRETVTLRLFMLAGTVMLFGSVLEYYLRGSGLRWWTFGTGWACALASIAIRKRAITALGRFWSLHVEIRDHHEFVRSGPFRFVRHPTYLSMVLELCGLGLILNAIVTPVVVAMIFVPTLVVRVRIEEQALLRKFGETYRDYQRSTPALIPYKWTSSK